MTGENDILESWEANAGNWIQTVTNQELESRRLVTDDAIVQAVMHYAPARILDLGCGEGWLSRALRKKVWRFGVRTASRHWWRTQLLQTAPFTISIPMKR
jgi:2-polyprenyl-3-methyl-5-hydroxy-6-metoxy-1,4-benzoquinol methylase